MGAIAQGLAGPLTGWMLGALALTTLLQLLLATMAFPLLRRPAPTRTWALAVLAAAIALAPFLIPANARPLRFVTACASILLILKLWDLHGLGREVDFGRFTTFLVNPFSLMMRRHGTERLYERHEVAGDVLRGIAGSILSALAIAGLYLVRWRDYPLLVEHVVKVVVIFTAVLCWLSTAVAVVRLGGGTISDFAHAPLLARTPAEFWRRYNRIFYDYFSTNIFRRAGRRVSPVAVTMFIFLISAVVHEYVFAMGIGRVQGFQTAFFLIQGAAVAATLRVRPTTAASGALWMIGTLAFNAVSSIFFFLSFHQIVRLYSNPLPAWLQW